jgi:hypothetical protein
MVRRNRDWDLPPWCHCAAVLGNPLFGHLAGPGTRMVARPDGPDLQTFQIVQTSMGPRLAAPECEIIGIGHLPV